MRLKGKKIATLVAEGVEDLEYYVPLMRLQEEGAQVLTAGLDLKTVRGKNGLEITPERLEKISFSSPYYYSTLSLTVRLDETRIRAVENLPTHTVGTLKASLAERYLGELGVTDIKTYDNQAHPYMDLLLGRLDAVVMDTPIALYYAYGQQFHNVELASTKFPIAIGIRNNDAKLLDAVNAALRQMRTDGTLKTIYQRWGLTTLQPPTTSKTAARSPT